MTFFALLIKEMRLRMRQERTVWVLIVYVLLLSLLGWLYLGPISGSSNTSYSSDWNATGIALYQLLTTVQIILIMFITPSFTSNAVNAEKELKTYDMLLCSTLLGVGIGLAFAALGNLIVQAVPPYQTVVASGMNTVLRTLGGALGGQIAATFVAASTVHGRPALTGFTQTFAMSALFLACCAVAGLLIPTLTPAVTSLPAAAISDAPAPG